MSNKILPPISENVLTRIVPGLSSEHQIVSLPYWAWFWLDDFREQHRIGYKALYRKFDFDGDLKQTLHNLAELHQEFSMREIYNLSNDNEVEDIGSLLNFKKPNVMKKNQGLNLPKIYKLFGFMSCATTLDAVWKRRNYGENNKIN